MNEDVEQELTRLHGHYFFTLPSDGQSYASVFAVSAAGVLRCKEVKNVIPAGQYGFKAIQIGRSLMVFESAKLKLNVKRISDIMGRSQPKVEELEPLRTRASLSNYALAQIGNRMVIITGGEDEESSDSE